MKRAIMWIVIVVGMAGALVAIHWMATHESDAERARRQHSREVGDTARGYSANH